MFPRQIEPILQRARKTHRVVTLVGPRQSGKTTLLEKAFPGALYHSLEAPDTRALALEDPRGFLDVDLKPQGNLRIIDEIQRAPELLSYIQGIVDQEDSKQHFLLQPHHRNFNKRIVKTPKLYFYDTGFLCYLLKVRNAEQLRQHPLRGSIFENWVIAEMMKSKYHQGDKPDYYFWRDQKGHEIDLVEDRGQTLFPTEIKSGATFHPEFIKNITYFNRLQSADGGMCVYGGNESGRFKGIQQQPWSNVT